MPHPRWVWLCLDCAALACRAFDVARPVKVQGRPMDISKDLARIALQEERLRFERFDAGIAWQIGSWLRNTAVSRGQSIAIDITLNGAPLFYCVLVGATPNNGEWIRRKKNVLARFHKSTYAVGL